MKPHIYGVTEVNQLVKGLLEYCTALKARDSMRRRIFSHMVGFLVIENGVFLFSTAIGVEMPLLINFAILLDILISVLMLGIFFTKIDGKIHADDADALTNVKD